jgi:hypothetical protein
MPEVCALLGLHPDALPDPTTFYHSLDRYAMYVWRALLRASAQQLRQSGQVALNSTFFERKQGSQYYLQRSGRTVKTIKATTLTDTASLAVLDVHCCIEREHDTRADPRVVRRNADDLRAVLADNGFQDWHTEYELAALESRLSCSPPRLNTDGSRSQRPQSSEGAHATLDGRNFLLNEQANARLRLAFAVLVPPVP